MAETTSCATHKRYAVVTGANNGIGFETCRQLASPGVIVVLTARDEKRRLDALHQLKGSDGISGDLLFHRLDVADPSSVAALAEFVKTQFGRLDILVNNAGITGAILDAEALKSEAVGDLIPNGWAKGILSDVDNLMEEKVDVVLSQHLKDFKAGLREAKGWPFAYTISKAALNAYTRILAKKFPNLMVNCVCPGFVKTEMNQNIGVFSAAEGAACPVKLALLPNDGPSGLFFSREEVTSFE